MTVLAGNGSGGAGAGQGGSGTPGASGGSGGSGGQGNAGGSGAAGGGDGGQGAGGQGSGAGRSSGSETPSWRDTLPADLKGNASLGRYSSPENLAKAYLSLESKLGQKGHILPTEKSSPEDWNALYDALGRPPIDKFEITGPKDREFDPEFIGKFKQAAHKSGMRPQQAQELLDWYMSDSQATMDEQMKAVKSEGERQLTALKQEYGRDWDGAVKRAISAADHVSKEFREYLETTGIGNDPQIIKALDKLGKLLGEDALRGEGGGGGMGMTIDQIDAEIGQIRNTPEFASFQDSPKKRQLNERLSALYQMKHSA